MQYLTIKIATKSLAFWNRWYSFIMTPQPDINVVIGELSLQIANLSRENAILKATIKALQVPSQNTDGGELQD